MEKLYNLRELSRTINLNYHTLRRWCQTGRVTHSRTPGGQLCMTETQVKLMVKRMEQADDATAATATQ